MAKIRYENPIEGNTCGDNGGRTNAGKPCSSLVLEEDGRCRFHPAKFDTNLEASKDGALRDSVVSYIDGLIQAGDIIAVLMTDGSYDIHIKRKGVYSSTSKEIVESDICHAAQVGAKIDAIQQKDRSKVLSDFRYEVMRNVRDEKIDVINYRDLNERSYMYRIDGMFYDIKDKKELEDPDGYITDTFPEFSVSSKEKNDAVKIFERFIDSLGDGFLHFIARALYPPHKKATIIIGRSSVGKTFFFDMLARCFKDTGVYRVKGDDFLQTKFNPVEASLARNFITMVDESEKKDKKQQSNAWQNIFNICGVEVMSVEEKGENTKEMRRMGNPVFVGNTPPPIDINSDAVRNRIDEGYVWIVGLPDIKHIVSNYENKFSRSRKPPMTTDSFDYLLQNETAKLATVNGEYDYPFGKLTEQEWEEFKIKMHPAAPYLTSIMIETLKDIDYELNKTKMGVYYEYFCRMADLKLLISGDIIIPKGWMIGELSDYNKEKTEDDELDEVVEEATEEPTPENIPLPEL